MSHPREPAPDYYSILGVLRDAKPEEITAAYYLLARKFHPDVTNEGSSAQKRFKAINEAYQTLSDPHRRRQYDRVRDRRARRRAQRHRRPSRRPHPVSGRTAAGPSAEPTRTGGPDLHLQLPITPEEARYGCTCPFTLSWSDPCDRCSATGLVQRAPCPTCNGAKAHRRRESLRVALPAGLQTGATVRIVGKGNRTVGTNRRGDLVLRIVVRPCW